jgi:hypothetical protein
MNMGEIRRGADAIQEAIDANENRQGGSFKPFLPSIFWKDDKEARYLLFLNPIDDIPQFDVVPFIPTEGGFPETVVAKTDPYFGEKADKFEKVWDATIRVTDFAVAVELEPTLELVGGRKRPRGFEVATKTFERKVFDDDGEDTGEVEEVTTPVVGIVAQSPYNFFNVVKSYDADEAPIHETALKITRIGKDQNTSYTVVGYVDQEIDLSNFIEFLEGINYLDDIDKVVEEIADLEPLEAAQHVGSLLLEKRITELVDEERYEELFEGVDESMDKFGNKRKKKGKGDKKTTERKARPSQRRKASDDDGDGDTGDDSAADADGGDDDAPEPEAKPKTRAKTATRKAAAKAKPKDEEVTSESPAKVRLAALREKAAKQRADKAADDE